MRGPDLFLSKQKKGQPCCSENKFPGLFTYWHRGLPIVIGALLLSAGPVEAKSLDEAINDAINNGGLECGDNIKPGSKLAAICDGATGPGSGGSSSGGGAVAAQTSAGIIGQVLAEARGEDMEMSNSVSELLPGLSIFLSGEYESLDQDKTSNEDGYDSDIGRFTIGSDYQFTDKVMAGVAFTYYHQDGDFDDGGDFDNDSYGVTFFASILPIDQAFVQVIAGYAAKDYDRTRIAEFENNDSSAPESASSRGNAKGDYDGDEYSAGILAGYDFTFNNLSVGPRLGLDYIRTEFDSYDESGNTGLELSFNDTHQTSLQSRLGLSSSVAFSTGFGVLLPQAGVNWVHEFEDDQQSETFSFKDDLNSTKFKYENEDPDRDFFEFSLGVSAVLPHGWLPFVQFRAIAGHDDLDSYVGAIGLRKEF